MNILKRTCSNCAAFNPAPSVDEPTCWNLVSIIDNFGTPLAKTSEPGPSDHCDDHLTNDEDKAQTMLIEEGREAGGFIGAYRALMAVSAAAQAMRQARGGVNP
jgi:hypothetical protein